MEVFNHAFDEQSCLGLQMTASDIHVHQLVSCSRFGCGPAGLCTSGDSH